MALTLYSDFGGYAEYKTFSEDAVMTKIPSNLSFGEAAAIPTSLPTALKMLRKMRVQEGQKILIYGASGSVGTYAVQLAKYMGAHVTGVCSTSNLDLIEHIGAEKTINYTKEDLTSLGTTYDVILDAVGKLPSKASKVLLSKHGKSMSVLKTSGKVTSEDLEYLSGLVENGHIKPVIDRTYDLEKIVEAHRYVQRGHKKGSVVVNIVKEM